MGFLNGFKQVIPQKDAFKGTIDKIFGGIYGQQRQIPARMNTGDFLSTYSESGWLYACTSKIATSVASTEITATFNGNPVASKTLDLLERPNPYMSKFEFLELTDTLLSLTGKCFWYITKNGKGEPVELWVVNPINMVILPDPDIFIKGYIYRVGTENVPLTTDEVIFINLPNPSNPYDGVGPAQAAGYSIETDKYANQYNRNFFYNNATPDTAILIENSLDDDSFTRMQKQWDDKFRGVDNSKKTAILEGIKDIKNLSTSAKDMDFANLKDKTRDEILGIFGVPKVLLGMTENVNFATADVSKGIFMENVVAPRLRRLSDKINNELVPLFMENLEIAFVEKVPGNKDFKLTAINAAVTNGYMSKEEAREQLNELLGIDLKPEDVPKVEQITNTGMQTNL